MTFFQTCALPIRSEEHRVGKEFFFSSRRRHTRYWRDWSSDVCSSDLVASGLADQARTALAGGSWGGYLTLLGLGTQPERWACGVTAVPGADYLAAYEDEMEPMRAFDRSLFGGSPDEVRERYERSSPLTYVAAVRVPVLVLAGANDPRCPTRESDTWLAAAGERGKEGEGYRFDAGHGSLVVDERVRQMRTGLQFVARRHGLPEPA